MQSSGEEKDKEMEKRRRRRGRGKVKPHLKIAHRIKKDLHTANKQNIHAVKKSQQQQHIDTLTHTHKQEKARESAREKERDKLRAISIVIYQKASKP